MGNEGFLVRAGSQVVLFDALFGKGLPDYDHVPPKVLDDMEKARPPFREVSIIFVSHIHPDHFDTESAARFVRSHPSSVVVAPRAVAQQLRKALRKDVKLQSQIRGISAEPGRIIVRREGGIQVGIFSLPHGSVENLAYLVDLNGRRVLHIGDADLSKQDLQQLKLPDQRIDLAFIPFWELTDDAEVVRDQIRANVIVPMHLITHATTSSSREYLDHVRGIKGMMSEIRSQFPNAVVFHSQLETKTF